MSINAKLCPSRNPTPLLVLICLMTVNLGAVASCTHDGNEGAQASDGDLQQEPRQERVPPVGDEVPTHTRTSDAAEAPPPAVEDCGLETYAAPGMPLFPIPPGAEARVTFAVSFRDEINPCRVIAFSILPRDTITLEAVLTETGAHYRASAGAGGLEVLGPEQWRWRAPQETGLQCIEITEVESGETMVLNAFVMRPYTGEETLNGYRIGSYADVPLNDDPAYERPRGFIELTEENRHTWVSPHFQLEQFACKQAGGFPKYLVLDTRLLLKLESLLEEVRESGIDAHTFHVMSAYRTPWYNAAIGNRTRYSRHAYGDAADIFIDTDRNGSMDDLTGDGRVTVADARILRDIVEGLGDKSWYMPFVGGLGLYGPKPGVRGPFIHVDTRGHRARW